MSVQCLCEKCGGTVPASLALYETDGSIHGVLRKQSVRKSMPIIVFVDNDEIADGYSTTVQSIYKAEVAEVVRWSRLDGRVYDDEDEFAEDYVTYSSSDASEDELEAEARELWKKHATKCIVCYSHAALLPKGCEVVE